MDVCIVLQKPYITNIEIISTDDQSKQSAFNITSLIMSYFDSILLQRRKVACLKIRDEFVAGSPVPCCRLLPECFVIIVATIYFKLMVVRLSQRCSMIIAEWQFHIGLVYILISFYSKLNCSVERPSDGMARGW